MNRESVAQWLLSKDRFLILTHVRPDGDTVGCAAALCHALREQGKTAYVQENIGASALFTPYFVGLLPPNDYTPDTVVAVDISAVGQIPDNMLQWLQRGIDLTIDHHPSQEFFAKETWVDPARAACGELIYEIAAQWGAISQAVALPLYVALSTDTGCFVYGNTTADTHRIAAALIDTGIDVQPVNKLLFRTRTLKRLQLEGLMMSDIDMRENGTIAFVNISLQRMADVGATAEDIDDISAFVGQIEGVETGATLRELAPNVWKLSLRTHPDLLNASHVCAQLGGGGHAAAAGATIQDVTIEGAKNAVMAAIAFVRQGKKL